MSQLAPQPYTAALQQGEPSPTNGTDRGLDDLVASLAPSPDNDEAPEQPEGKKARAQQQVWKAHEVDILQQGVTKYGRNWKAILEDSDFAPTLGGRSAGSLKLKWYKMTKEHEERLNTAVHWAQPGHPIAGPPYGRTWMDSLTSPLPGEAEMEPWSHDEMQTLKEGVARYGSNWHAMLQDPGLAPALSKRSAEALQSAWTQMQDVMKNWAPDLRADSGRGGNEGCMDGGGAASMRSWGRQETEALVQGFEVYGTDWKAILHDPRFRPHLLQRTCHSLKSKWARMMKKRKRDGDIMEPMTKSHCSMPLNFGEGGGSAMLGGISSEAFSNPYGTMNTGPIPGTTVPEGLPKPNTLNEDYDRSLSEYTRQISASPANAVLYNHRGVVYYAKGFIDKALEDFSTAIALDQNYADAYCNRGMAFNSKGEFDMAIIDCSTAIDINPTSSSATNAFLTRALTHYNKGMLEQCIFDCDSTLALRPRCVSALVTRGLTVLALAKEAHRSDADTQRNYMLALADFKEAMQIDPGNQQARVWYDEARMLLLERQSGMDSGDAGAMPFAGHDPNEAGAAASHLSDHILSGSHHDHDVTGSHLSDHMLSGRSDHDVAVIHSHAQLDGDAADATLMASHFMH